MDTRRRTPRFRYMGEGMGSPELPHPKFRENTSSKTRHDGAVVAERVPAQRGRSRSHGVAGEEMGISIKREGARMLCGSKADLRRRWRTRSGRGGPQMLMARLRAVGHQRSMAEAFSFAHSWKMEEATSLRRRMESSRMAVEVARDCSARRVRSRA